MTSAYITSLISARDRMAADLAACAENPKPSYTWNRKQVSWTEYQQMLIDGIDKLNSMIDARQEVEDDTPQEYVSYGI